MPRPSIDLANNFATHISSLESTRQKMEGLLVSNQIGLDDIEKVYAGLYLSVFTEFEGLIEELFLGLLAASITSSKSKPTVHSSNSTIVREVMMIGKNYLDWLPYDRTLERAKVLFQNGEPFSLLQANQSQSLTRFLRIRNVIAHKSDYALQQFQKEVIGNKPLLPQERTPTGFLRSQYRAWPSQSQYENIIQELQGMAYAICQ